MKFPKLALGLVPLMLAACAYIAPIQPAPTFYVMRHLHTPAGATNPNLTAEGQRQAALIAAKLANNPPATIFVSDTKRAMQTATPLAASLGITPRIYNPGNTPALIDEVMKEPPPVLIVGHSNTVPDIVAALGGTRPAPLVHEDFGDLWTIRGGTTRREKIAE